MLWWSSIDRCSSAQEKSGVRVLRKNRCSSAQEKPVFECSSALVFWRKAVFQCSGVPVSWYVGDGRDEGSGLSFRSRILV